MNNTLSPPRPATVLAIGISPRHSVFQTPAAAIREFTALITESLGNNCHIQRSADGQAGFALTGIVPDHAQTLSPLRRLDRVQSEFHRSHPDIQVRYIVHHGVVFQSPGGHSGSALRSAHSRLLRLPVHLDKAATLDFVAFTETWPSQTIRFEEIPNLPEGSGLLAFQLPAPGNDTPMQAVSGLSPAQCRYITTQLAEHLGPFAEVLVSTAQRTCTSTQQLIIELSREIDAPAARADFLAKAQAFPAD